MARALELTFVVIIGLTQLPWICKGIQINDTKALHDKLLTGYYRDVRPVVNQSGTVQVAVAFDCYFLESLDEVTGTVTIIGTFLMAWRDETMSWDPSAYGGTESVFISHSDVWVPEMIMLSPVDDVLLIGRKQFYKIRYFKTGLAYFQSAERIESACNINVRKYPFDVQDCNIYFIASGYFRTEVELMPAKDAFDMTYFQSNSVWDIVNTTIYVQDSVVLIFNIQLKRKAEFIVINVLLPITLLGFLNVLVFLLVPESGERISYCITVLLAISVFMTIISDTLPKSSEPVPIISYKLMIDVIISMLITVVTILNLRLHNKDDGKPVPMSLQKIYLALCCRSCKTRESEYVAERSYIDSGHLPGNSRPVYIVRIIQRGHDCNEYQRTTRVNDGSPRSNRNVTWNKIGDAIDALAFILFTIAILANFLMFILLAMD